MNLPRIPMTSAFFVFSLLATPYAQSTPLPADLTDAELARILPYLAAQQDAFSSFSAPTLSALPSSTLPQGDSEIPSSAVPFQASAPALPHETSPPPYLAPHLEEYPPLHMSRMLTHSEQQELQRAIQDGDEEAIKRLLGASELTPWEVYAQTHPDFAKALQEPFFVRFLAGVWQEHTHPTRERAGLPRKERKVEEVMGSAYAAFQTLLKIPEFQKTFQEGAAEQAPATASLWSYMVDTFAGLLPDTQQGTSHGSAFA